MPEFRAVCNDCGVDIRENHMGQSFHRCNFKRRSEKAAERLIEVIVDEADYWDMIDARVVLTLRETDEKQSYRLCSDREDADGLPAILTRPEADVGETYKDSIFAVCSDSERLLITIEKRSKLLFFDSSSMKHWVTSVEIERTD